MLVLISYDVATDSVNGKTRLRRIAKYCSDYGQRVQYSVFECEVDPAQWVALRQKLLATMDESADSLRFYFLGSSWHRRIEHHGTKPSMDYGSLMI